MASPAPVAPAASASPSRTAYWAGWVIGGLPSALMLAAGVTNLMKPQFVVESTAKFGYPEHSIVPIGAALLVCTILYLVPRTAVLGAILLTGYLGGAVATHVIGDDPIVQIVFPAVFASFFWIGLLLREPRLRELLPLRR